MHHSWLCCAGSTEGAVTREWGSALMRSLVRLSGDAAQPNGRCFSAMASADAVPGAIGGRQTTVDHSSLFAAASGFTVDGGA